MISASSAFSAVDHGPSSGQTKGHVQVAAPLSWPPWAEYNPACAGVQLAQFLLKEPGMPGR